MVKTNLFKRARKNKKNPKYVCKNQQQALLECQRIRSHLPPVMNTFPLMYRRPLPSLLVILPLRKFSTRDMKHYSLKYTYIQRFKDKCAERRLHFSNFT